MIISKDLFREIQFALQIYWKHTKQLYFSQHFLREFKFINLEVLNDFKVLRKNMGFLNYGKLFVIFLKCQEHFQNIVIFIVFDNKLQ